LIVTATSNGSPLANTYVDFVISSGGGLLATSTTSSMFSGIYQVQTNTNGQAIVYFKEPAGSSGSSQVVAAAGSSQDLFSILSGGTGVPALPVWGYIILAILMVTAMSRQLPKKSDSR
jgi:hypothetical protein